MIPESRTATLSASGRTIARQTTPSDAVSKSARTRPSSATSSYRSQNLPDARCPVTRSIRSLPVPPAPSTPSKDAERERERRDAPDDQDRDLARDTGDARAVEHDGSERVVQCRER